MICGKRIPSRGISQSDRKKFEVLKVPKEGSVAKGIKISKENGRKQDVDDGG